MGNILNILNVWQLALSVTSFFFKKKKSAPSPNQRNNFAVQMCCIDSITDVRLSYGYIKFQKVIFFRLMT